MQFHFEKTNPKNLPMQTIVGLAAEQVPNCGEDCGATMSDKTGFDFHGGLEIGASYQASMITPISPR